MNDAIEEDIKLIPRFNYKILFDMQTLGDKLSCFAVHDKFIAVGCASGCIRICDPLGSLRTEFTVKAHTCEVTQIAIDKTGSYVLSCSNDRIVNIYGIGCNELNERFNVRAKSIAIAENFTTRGGQRFLVGLDQLHLFERGGLLERRLFQNYKKRILYAGREEDGLIYAISWQGDVIAFTNETGTRVFDVKTFTTLALIQPIHQKVREFSFRYPPRHSWLCDDVLAIGWATTVTVARITAEKRLVEVIHRFKLDGVHVAGISYTAADDDETDTNWREIAIFGVKIVEGRIGDGSISTLSQISTPSITPSVAALPMHPDQDICKELMLVLPLKLDSFFIAAEDEIVFTNVEAPNAFLHKYHMDALPGDSVYYLMSPEAVIEARPCSADNNVQWYLKNGDFVPALRCALQHRDDLYETSVSEVGRQLIEDLITKENGFEMAASYLPEICERHKDEWEFYVSEFDKHGHVLKLVPYLPLKQPQLEPECYEYVLSDALYSKAELFLKLIEIYPSELYRLGSIIVKTLERVQSKSLDKDERRMLFLALARLYAYSRDFDKALNMFLQMKDTRIFQFIRQHHLFKLVRGKVIQLMEIDEVRAIQLLQDHEDEFVDESGPASIVDQLRKMPKFQMEYVSSLMSRNLGLEYADLLVKLYAEHAPTRLLPFLQRSDAYDLEKAIIECKKHQQLKSALVFLLGRTGNKLEALEAIESVDLAIEFCAEHAEEELWLRLIELATKQPEDVTKILSVAGTYVDPLVVIEKIPATMQVPRLQASLHKVLQDAKLQLALIEDCQSVTFNDVFGLFDEFTNPSAAIVDGLDQCCVCRKLLLLDPVEVFLLNCNHACHVRCMSSNRRPPLHDADETFRQESFLAVDENSTEPLPTAECPVCWTDEPGNPFV